MTAPSISSSRIPCILAALVAIPAKKTARRAGLFFAAWLLLASLANAQTNYVDVIVNNSLYSGGQIGSSLNQYMSDITAQGYTPRLVTTPFANPAALRTALANDYSTYHIKGAVMVGDMPIQYYNQTGPHGTDPPTPCDLYYEDLNGTWSDADGDGVLDTRSGNVAPEIFVSHIVTSNLTDLQPGRTEAGMINNYFAKDHAYRLGQIRLPQNGLYYRDDWWPGYMQDVALDVPGYSKSVAGHVDVVCDPATTVAADCKARIAQATSPGYESVFLGAHGCPTSVAFMNNGQWADGRVFTSDLSGLNPQSLFYTFMSCQLGNYSSPDTFASEAVFGTGLGLVSVANAGSDTWHDMTSYNTSIGQGATFGQSWNTWGQNGFLSDYYTASLTMFGDPLLRSQAYTAASYATWNGGTASWTNQGTNWTAAGSAFTWNNLGIGATFNAPAPTGPISISGKVYAYGVITNADGYSFSGSSSDVLETLGGGITANGNTTINCPILIGDNQSWTVAAGKTLTVSNVLHLTYNDLTINGAGTTIISGTIDYGDVLGIVGDGRVGNLIQAGSGPVYLTGMTNFSGNIAAQAGAGILYIAPPGGGAVTWDGAFFGGGTISFNCSALTLRGASNFTGTLLWQQPTSLTFAPAVGVTSTYGCVLNNNGSVVQNGPGTTILSGNNSYSGTTTISNGALEANTGKGIPTGSFLSLDGGVLQSDGSSTVTFTRSLGTSGNMFQMTANGGGFSAGNAPMVVNISGNSTPTTLTWGAAPGDVGGKLVGTLKFGSTSAAATTTFQNPIALGSTNRTIQVDDNPNTIADVAVIAGSISGAAGIIKTGAGVLKLSGANSYGGTTSINAGVLLAGVGGTTGIPSASFINLNGGILQVSDVATFTRSLGTSGATFQWGLNGGGFSAATSPLTVNVGGQATPTTLVWGSVSADVGTKIVGPLLLNTASSGNSLTFQNGIDLAGGANSVVVGGNTVYLNGAIVDSVGGGSLTKTGPGVLCIGGSSPNTYTGPTTLSGGDVYLNKSVLSGYAIPGDLYLGGNTQMWVNLQSDNQIAPTSKWTFVDTGAYLEVKLLGHNVTVAGLSDTTGQGVVENTWNESGYGALTLTVNTAAGSFSYNGWLRDTCTGSCGKLSLAKTGAGTQTFIGSNIFYTGTTTISGGTLVLQDVSNFASSAIVNNATLEIDAVSSCFTLRSPISGSGSLNINGSNLLTIGGSNSYTGATTISAGTVTLASTTGYAIPGDLVLTGSTQVFVALQGDNQIAPTSRWTWNGTGAYREVKLLGHNVTVAGLSDATGQGVVENTWGESGYDAVTLTINAAAGSFSYNGWLRDTCTGSCGALSLVKTGAGTQTLTGSYVGQYTGGLIVNAGLLNYSGGTTPTCGFIVNGGTLSLGTSTSRSITSLQMTGGSLSGGTLTATSTAYDLEAGTISVLLGGTVGFNKSTPGTVTFTKAPPNGPYSISNGMLVLGTLSKTMSGGSLTMTGGTLSGSGTLTAATGYNYNIQAGTIGMILGGSGRQGSVKLNKTGSAVAILSGANTYAGLTTVAGGALELGPAAQNCIFNLGGADIQSGAIIFDYAGGADPIATIQSMLKASRDGGRWELEQFRDSTALATGLTLGCFDNTATGQVKVMATYPGDFNLDGVVDNQDRAIWFANAMTGATWQQGDANYDGVVDGRDRDLLFASLGLPQLAVPSPAAASVPEPGTLALLAAGLLSLLAFAWRKRRA
jgi:autotransporter-associated beta strand protein